MFRWSEGCIDLSRLNEIEAAENTNFISQIVLALKILFYILPKNMIQVLAHPRVGQVEEE